MSKQQVIDEIERVMNLSLREQFDYCGLDESDVFDIYESRIEDWVIELIGCLIDGEGIPEEIKAFVDRLYAAIYEYAEEEVWDEVNFNGGVS